MTYQYYEWTGFREADLLNAGSHNGTSLGCGDVFTMPTEATVCITACDNDSSLSGDAYHNENADDHYGQHAWIEGPNGTELGNGGQIYAESYYWVYDQHGNWYVLVEIEQEGTDDDYFSFYTGGEYTVPSSGAQLTVHSACNISGNWLDYTCLDAGDKTPDLGSITGRLFVDADCDNTENNADTGTWEDGVDGATVKLLDAHGNVIATTTTDHYGTYKFDNIAPGDYQVQFFNPDGTEFVQKDVGHYGEDSDADQNTGKTITFHVGEGQHIVNIDAGVKEVPQLTTVSGRYFYDEDRNHLESAGDTGLEGKTVILADAHGNPIRTTTTDANGNYTFTDVVAGDYIVKFEVEENAHFVSPDQGNDPTIDSDVISSDAHFGRTSVFHVSMDCPQLNIDAGVKKEVGTISGTVFCDTDCDGLQKEFVLVEGCDYTFEAEHFTETGYQTIHSDAASGGTFLKLNCAGGTADASITFDKKSGVYDMKFFFQDENDGKSTIMVKVNGHLVDTIKLDGDGDGAGSDNGSFSEFIIENVQINEGDDISIWVDGDHGEWVRFDKLDLEGRDSFAHATETTEVVVAHEGFEGGAQGWSDNQTGHYTGGDFLGYHGSKHGVDTQKTFDVPAGTDKVVLTFDFLEIDSWDNEAFQIVINGQTVNLGHFRWDYDEGATSFDAGNGITVEKAGFVKTGQIGNTHEWWSYGDSKHAFTITIDNPAEHLTIGFDSRLSSSNYDESWGIDNLKIVAHVTEEVSEPIKEGVTIKLLALDGTVLETTTTDADGNYAFTNIPAGDYQIMGVAPDGTEFTIQDVNSNANDDIDSDVDSNGLSGIVTVTKDGTVDIDLGVCKKELGSLSGRYFCDINYNDVDDGEPGVEGVIVYLLDANGNRTGDSTSTAADGSYSFGDLAPGTYGVEFTDENGVTTGKTLVAPNDPDGNGDDTNDSDAIGDTVSSVISGISVVAGQNTPDNDAGIEELGSLSGRYFCDDDRDGFDNDGVNGGPSDGIADIEVTLLDANGAPVLDGANQPITTRTDANGDYAFTGLVPGTYGVSFTAVAGKFLTERDADGNLSDDIDSDASDQEDGTYAIQGIMVEAGQNTPDNDVGVFPNTDPIAIDDMAKACADEFFFVDLIDNDLDPDGDPFSVTSISDTDETAGVGESITLADGAIVTLNADGTVTVDGIAAYADLEIRQEAMDSFSYTIEDELGATATGDVDLTFCGALNTVNSIADNFPITGNFGVGGFFIADAYTGLTLNTGDPRFDGVLIEAAYCLEQNDSIVFNNADFNVTIYAAVEGRVDDIGNGLDNENIDGKLDLINWIINEDFTSRSNGDTTGGGAGLNYTDTEIQAAIWGITDNNVFVEDPGLVSGIWNGSEENAQEILDLALAEGVGYEPGHDDLMTFIVIPDHDQTSQGFDESNDLDQSFIIALPFDEFKEDCIC